MAEKREEKLPEGGKKNKTLLIVGVVILILLIGGGVAGWFFLKPEPPPAENLDPGLQVPVPDLKQSKSIGPMVNIDEFVVNIISSDVPHYVKASLTVELNNSEVQPEVEQRMPQVRDAVLLLIGNKTYEELQDLQGKQQLKAELKSKLNSFLHRGQIQAIYFTNFVVQ